VMRIATTARTKRFIGPPTALTDGMIYCICYSAGEVVVQQQIPEIANTHHYRLRELFSKGVCKADGANREHNRSIQRIIRA
jgi:hypothetical protein